MSSGKNMELWDKVEKTDPQFTKHVNQRGGYTAIDPMYQTKMATKEFGPFGMGWGLKESDLDFSMAESTRLVIHKAVFFYIVDGKEASFPIHNTYPMSFAKRDGTIIIDPDFAKKIETNTISKALSRLGFNADVFMGMFDDQEYVEQVFTETSIEKAEDKDAEIAAKREELTQYVVRHIDAIKASVKLPEASGVFKSATRHLERQRLIKDIADIAEKGIKAISKEYESKKEELNNETA